MINYHDQLLLLIISPSITVPRFGISHLPPATTPRRTHTPATGPFILPPALPRLLLPLNHTYIHPHIHRIHIHIEITHPLSLSRRQLPTPLPPTMTSYAPAPIVKHAPPPTTTRSTESRYWRRYRNPTYCKEVAPITHVQFAPNKPHRLAVTASSEVKVYAPRSNKVVKTIARFKETARSGEIRSDGNLLVAGDDSGMVQVNTQSNTSQGEREREVLGYKQQLAWRSSVWGRRTQFSNRHILKFSVRLSFTRLITALFPILLLHLGSTIHPSLVILP